MNLSAWFRQLTIMEARVRYRERGRVMGLYKRGGVWWYEFHFAGQRIPESSKSSSKLVAQDAERQRRRRLEEGYHGIKRKQQQPKTFAVVAKEWLTMKTPSLSPRSVDIEETNIEHLIPMFGNMLIGKIEPEDISRYQQRRLQNEAANKTIDLEIGTLRSILRRHGLWVGLRVHVRFWPGVYF